mmetsp:Transcript_9271/g.25086  ORF Transcript_9271/g.25086 Transcript_9271/m.25086 type:complete len:236 (+) Transcript_9271:203-910(+)
MPVSQPSAWPAALSFPRLRPPSASAPASVGPIRPWFPAAPLPATRSPPRIPHSPSSAASWPSTARGTANAIAAAVSRTWTPRRVPVRRRPPRMQSRSECVPPDRPAAFSEPALLDPEPSCAAPGPRTAPSNGCFAPSIRHSSAAALRCLSPADLCRRPVFASNAALSSYCGVPSPASSPIHPPFDDVDSYLLPSEIPAALCVEFGVPSPPHAVPAVHLAEREARWHSAATAPAAP